MCCEMLCSLMADGTKRFESVAERAPKLPQFGTEGMRGVVHDCLAEDVLHCGKV